MFVYLDNSATTRQYERVTEVMKTSMEENYGNPSSLHKLGLAAEKQMRQSRKTVADSLGAKEDEVFFTSGGTESDNTALFGVARARKRTGKKIITTKVEHPAVMESCKALEAEGFQVEYIGVDDKCRLNMEELHAAINEDTILISIMAVNNETGTIMPIEEIAKIKENALLHTDAVQAVGKAPVQVAELGVDMLTLSAHKINGPKGCGALYVRHQTDLQPVLWGGGQERSLRSGTENLPGIVGLGVAAELTAQRWPQQARRAAAARDCFWHELSRQLPGVVVNGGWERRLPGNLNLSFEGLESAALLLFLDMAGVAVSAASACSSGRAEPSHVLQALGLPEWRLKSAVRLSFGWENTLMEARQAAAIVAEQVRLLRQETAAEQLDESFSQPGD